MASSDTAEWVSQYQVHGDTLTLFTGDRVSRGRSATDSFAVGLATQDRVEGTASGRVGNLVADWHYTADVTCCVGSPRSELAARSGIHFAPQGLPAITTDLINGVSDMHAEIVTRPALRVAAVHHVGPYQRISEAFGKLGAIVRRRAPNFRGRSLSAALPASLPG